MTLENEIGDLFEGTEIAFWFNASTKHLRAVLSSA